MSALSVRRAYAGREVLLTGASGFVGKVVLLTLLHDLPDGPHVHLLVRAKGGVSPQQRFLKIVNESPAFASLHEQFGDTLGEHLGRRITVHDGDVTAPDFGLAPSSAADLRGRLDLVINCAAVVDFEPDVRLSVATNIDGALNAAAFAASCASAGLVQISTCYVAGRRDGRLAERHHVSLPNGAPFDAERELADLRAAVADLESHHASESFSLEQHAAAAEHLERRAPSPDPAHVARQASRMRESAIADAWRALGVERAGERGYPNTYTYTKGIAERLLASRYPTLPLAIVRPAVVESALAFPFAGWNEGFNTCGPLAFLIGTWFKAMPGRAENPFDVVPVDLTARAIALVGAAVIERRNRPVYQIATSERNRLTVGRANELTALGQRTFLRANGENAVDRLLKSRSDTTLYLDAHPLSVRSVDTLMNLGSRWLRRLPERTHADVVERANGAALQLERKRRTLQRVDRMVEAFTPFTRDLRQSFIAVALSSHDVVEPEFAWCPERIDWRSYWLDIHMPGMRRWSFPLFDGTEVPTFTPETPVTLAELESPHALTPPMSAAGAQR